MSYFGMFTIIRKGCEGKNCVDANESSKAVKIVEAYYRSAKNHRPVKFSLQMGGQGVS